MGKDRGPSIEFHAMNVNLATLLSTLRAGLTTRYGPRLRGLYLCGSFARGEADEESDVDILVVLDDFVRYGREVDLVSELTSALSLQHGVSISSVFVREREWLSGETPFLANVREEAIAA